MSSLSFGPNSVSRRRIPLAEIDAAVSARLGPTRGIGNSQPACFNRQVAMYLASHVGRWSTKIIGRFYGGRDHSTVCYGIQKVESLRESNPEFDSLLSELKYELTSVTAASADTENTVSGSPVNLRGAEIEELAERIVTLVFQRLNEKYGRAQEHNSHDTA
ncbi:MAG: helix-turn-helix domain-containing protein [Bryobacteraceae bacterium]